jgi:glycosyltransferase involved in cell wall biosynthesis
MGGGGAERQLCYLAKGLVDNSFEVHVVLLTKGSNFQRLSDSGAIIHEVNSFGYYDLRIIFKLFSLFRIHKPDLVQCWQRPMDLFASIAAIFSGVPFVTAERTNPDAYSKSFKGLLRAIIGQFSSAIISNSGVGKKYWEKTLFRSIPNIVIPNILPLSELQEVEKKPNLPEKKEIIIVGRLSPEKNHLNILKALSSIRLNNSYFSILIVGDGPMKNELVKCAFDLGLNDKIKFIPYSNSVWDLMRSSKILVSISNYEGMPNVVIECAALKVPMILSRIIEHTSIFSDDDCLFVDPNDLDDISRKVYFALSSDEILKANSNSAYTKVTKYESDQVIPIYIDIYNKIITNNA